MRDIHAIIAAAKRVRQQQPFGGKDAALYIALGDARIAMAEALAELAQYDENWTITPNQIARECLDRIVKEWQR